MKVSEILSKAADLIEPEGKWTKMFYETHDGRFCAYGAIDYVCHSEYQSVRRAAERLRDVIGSTHIAPWNDAPERTQAEVVAALRQASTLAKEQEDK